MSGTHKLSSIEVDAATLTLPAPDRYRLSTRTITGAPNSADWQAIVLGPVMMVRQPLGEARVRTMRPIARRARQSKP